MVLYGVRANHSGAPGFACCKPVRQDGPVGATSRIETTRSMLLWQSDRVPPTLLCERTPVCSRLRSALPDGPVGVTSRVGATRSALLRHNGGRR
jgi:hypothetical protein